MLSLSLSQLYFWGLILLIFFYCLYIGGFDKLTPDYGIGFGTIVLALFAIYCISQVPLELTDESDRSNYANTYLDLTNKLGSLKANSDWGFNIWMRICHIFGGVNFFFTATATVYVGSYLWAVKRMMPQHVFPMFLLVVAAFQFFAYGVNTMRAGMAFGILMLAMTYYRQWWKMALLMLISLSIHFSMIIPIFAFFMARIYTKPNVYMILWVVCIGLSLAFGNYFNTLFESMAIETDSRASYLTTANEYYKIGFRIDFVIYSCVPIILGYYYILKKGFNNDFYNIIFSTYIIANAFWILVIRANFTDRFAYLSWFLYPILLLYPVLEEPRLVRRQTTTIDYTFILYSLFMIFMSLRGTLTSAA